MATMVLNALATRPVRVRSSNYTTANGYPTRINTKTKPSGDGVVICGDEGGVASPAIRFSPYGRGADDSGYFMMILGWTVHVEPGSEPMWIVQPLATITVTLSTAVGLAGCVLTASDRFADTLAITLGNSNVSVEVVSNTINKAAYGEINTRAFELIEFIFDNNSSATGSNCLVSKTS